MRLMLTLTLKTEKVILDPMRPCNVLALMNLLENLLKEKIKFLLLPGKKLEIIILLPLPPLPLSFLSRYEPLSCFRPSALFLAVF